MTVNDVLLLIGGLSLFLLGMNMMGEGLENACGNKMKKILEKLTSNRFVGVLVGMLITMVIQSSSATTVMVVGFVNAGMMTLAQAVWVIMGANIGTTITGQLVALDVGMVAPIFAIVGVVMIVFVKKPVLNEIGKIFCGFGILFIGMGNMSDSMAPLKDFAQNNEQFGQVLSQLAVNPILGILVGAVFTAIIQSSSASVGIMQALARSGVVPFGSSVYILFGQNIGTCVTALLASLGTNRAAKRTTMIHFSFNIIGTIIFTIICYSTSFLSTSFVDIIESITPNNPAQQIANLHTIFNISTTIILLPFGTYLVKLAEKLLPDKGIESDSIFMYLGNDINLHVGGAALHLENTRLEIERMYEIAKDNVSKSFDSLIDMSLLEGNDFKDEEELIDKLNEGISKQITKCLAHDGSSNVSVSYSAYLTISTNIERLSDHAMNLYEHASEYVKRGIKRNEEVRKEITIMKDITLKMLDVALNKDKLSESLVLEQNIDDLTEEYRANMMERLKTSICTAEGSVIYSSVLIDFERLGDHLLNISENAYKIA